ncbi:MAG: glycosyltransferase family A protein [Cyanobacteria bacterium J06638_7]
MRVPGLVSTIIPVYNRPYLLAEAVESVLGQTYRQIEIIIVDDGSTDHTAEVARSLQSQAAIRIIVIRQANSGPGVARQTGLEASSGEFIQFLDSDDLLLPGKFAAQVRAMQQSPHCGICYGPSGEENHAVQPPARVWPMRATGRPIPYLFPLLLQERWWTTSSPLYRYNLLERVGPWQPWINEEDWEYDARCGATGTPLAWVEEPCSIRRINLGGEHLSAGGSTDPRKLADRAKARRSILGCARMAEVNPCGVEMQHYSNAVFLLAWQSELAGELSISEQFDRLAQEASKPFVCLRIKQSAWRFAASLLGIRSMNIARLFIIRMLRISRLYPRSTA